MEVVMAIGLAVLLIVCSYLVFDNKEKSNKIKELKCEVRAINIANDLLRQKNEDLKKKNLGLVTLVNTYKQKLGKVSDMFK